MATSGDSQTFARATGVCFLGLAIHVVITAGLIIYSALNPADHAAVTVAVYAGMGIPVWAVLAVLFDFHRRERLESIEESRLEAEGASSAFDDLGDEFRVSARRLAGVQRFVLPIVSLSIAAVLLSVGVVRLIQVQGRGLFETRILETPEGAGWAASIGVVLGVLGFIFARYVSGMAQQTVWKALRGGATFAVGFSLFGVATAIGYGVQMLLGQDLVLRSLTVIFPIASIVLGAEIVLNFLLAIYRPRLTGEDPHAAFDSRLLGLLAAPDKIAENVGEALNYQFGVRVTETWFYLLLKRWWVALVAMCVLVGWLMTSLVVIEPHQRALIVTNGAIDLDDEGRATEVGPGLHLKLPWPLARVSIPEFRTVDADGNELVRRTTTGVRTVNLGTNPALATAEAILWTNDHTAEEVFNLVQPTRITSAIEDTGLLSEQTASVAGLGDGLGAVPDMRSGGGDADGADLDNSEAAADLSLVAIESPMTWAVGDLLAYEVLAVPGHRERVIRAMGQRALLLHAGGESIDEILSGDRQRFVAGLETEIAAGMDSLSRVTLEAQLGPQAASALGEGRTAIELLNVGTGNVHPPREVAASFERVVQAAQIVETRIATAETAKIRTLSAVAGSVTRAEAIVEALGETEALSDSSAASEELARQEQVVRAMIEGAGGEAGTLLLDASAMRWEQHMGERGRAALYGGQLAAFTAAPAVYRSQLYFDAISEVMSDTRVFWLSESLNDSLTVLDLKAEQAVDVFDENVGAGQQIR